MINRIKILKIFFVTFISFFGLSVFSQTTNIPKEIKLTFIEYCNSSELSKDKIHTLVSLKEKYKIYSCDKLFKKLNGLEFISVRGKRIKDVSVFKYFSNLKRLGLDKNKINDLSVFESFDNITYLSLQDNMITDVRPLLKMKSLEKIYLDRNPIEKESGYPTTTQSIKINEFCFDHDKFNAVFNKGKDNVRLPKEDVRAIIKNVINYPRLQKYYHFKQVPNRSPLQIYFNFDLPTDKLGLIKFGKKVLTVKKPNELSLKIKIVVRGDLALVKIIYPPEGVRGYFRMGKSISDWTILNSHLYE